MTGKKTVVNIETREIWTIRRSQPPRHGWCYMCNTQVELVTPEEASIVTVTGLRHIFRLIEQAQVHFLETPTGGVLLCLLSLLDRQSKESG